MQGKKYRITHQNVDALPPIPSDIQLPRAVYLLSNFSPLKADKVLSGLLNAIMRWHVLSEVWR